MDNSLIQATPTDNGHFASGPFAAIGQDEYDNYIEEIYLLLQKGSSHEAIAKCLQWVETDQMEVPASPQRKLLTVAARLRELRLPSTLP